MSEEQQQWHELGQLYAIRKALRYGYAKQLCSYTLRRYPTVYAKRVGAVGKAFDKRQSEGVAA